MRVRRSLLRLLRTRNLVAVTIILMLLYLLKKAHREDEASVSVAPLELNQNENIKSGESKKDYFVPTTLKKKDWHNRTQIAMEAKRVGLGEQGRSAILPIENNDKGLSIQDLEAELYAVNGFNGALSDHIHLNRSLPDIRHPKCNHRMYIASLPTVSVVVPFHNEHWSTLLRTAYSVLYRSPEHLIKEVLLVDDASTKEFLGEKLDKYLATSMPKVRVVRVANRSGLITARLKGARAATGDVLIFLDSHTEANVNWLPPLLEPIALDHRTVVCPFIDVVAYDTFEYRAQDEGARGAFDWELFYKRLPVLPSDEANMPEPFASPVMAGGLFAISRFYFWELGGYDPGLDIWGGEQYELSFKIWQCGGRMVDAPCSRVGHIYRKFAPFPNPAHGDFVGKNYRRVAEVWMDEYAQYLYNRRPHYRNIDPGDLTAQRAIRTRLKCKPFKWFMTQIAFDLTHKYPPVEPLPYAEGRIRPIWDNSFCVDAANGGQMDKVKLSYCTGSEEQYFILSYHKDIRLKSRLICWDLPESADGSPVLLFSCHLGGGNQAWAYKNDTVQLIHPASGKCVAAIPGTLDIFVVACDPDSFAQRWNIEEINDEMMELFDKQVDRVTGTLEPWPAEDKNPREKEFPLLTPTNYTTAGGLIFKWLLLSTTKQIVHSSSACLAFAPDTHSLFVSKCNPDALGQRWTIDAINVERMAKWDKDKLESHQVTGPEETWRD